MFETAYHFGQHDEISCCPTTSSPGHELSLCPVYSHSIWYSHSSILSYLIKITLYIYGPALPMVLGLHQGSGNIIPHR